MPKEPGIGQLTGFAHHVTHAEELLLASILYSHWYVCKVWPCRHEVGTLSVHPSVHFDMTVPARAGSTPFCIREDNLDKTQYIQACPPRSVTLVSHSEKLHDTCSYKFWVRMNAGWHIMMAEVIIYFLVLLFIISLCCNSLVYAVTCLYFQLSTQWNGLSTTLTHVSQMNIDYYCSWAVTMQGTTMIECLILLFSM